MRARARTWSRLAKNRPFRPFCLFVSPAHGLRSPDTCRTNGRFRRRKAPGAHPFRRRPRARALNTARKCPSLRELSVGASQTADRRKARVFVTTNSLDAETFCSYIISMITVTYDEAKRAANLAKHKIDFKDAAAVFAGPTFEFEDLRFDYGEDRIITIGHLNARMVMVVWTERPKGPRIISMRKCNAKERKIYAPHFV